MTMTGRVPDKIGKDGIEHNPVVDRAYEKLLQDPAVKDKAAEALIDASEESASNATPPPASEEPVGSKNRRLLTMARYIKLEANVTEAIQQEFHTADDDRVWRDLDCVVVEDGHAPVGVEVKAVGDTRNLRQAALRLAGHVKAGKIGAGVIVSAGTDNVFSWPLPENVWIVAIKDHGNGEVSSTDADRIRAAIRSALEQV
jgi:hypothetical protein